LARFFRIASWIGLVVLALVLLQQNITRRETETALVFGEFMQKVESGEIASLTISPKNIGTGKLATGKEYVVNLPADQQTYIAAALAKIGKDVEVKQPSISDVWVSGLFYLLVTGLLLLLFFAVLSPRHLLQDNYELLHVLAILEHVDEVLA